MAEELGVRIGIHPDDPPVADVGGIPRCIFGTFDGYRRALLDWPTWVSEGLVDGVYLWFREFVDPALIVPQTEQAVELIAGRCPLIAELSCYHRGSLKTAEALLEGARLARQGGANAVGVYRGDPVEALDLWPAVEQIGEDNRS